MVKVTWRNLVARKVRLLLSALAIVLGVAFVAGSLIFTDAMGGAFDDIIDGSTADVEVAWKGADDWAAQEDARVVPASVVEDLRRLPQAAGVYPQTALQSVYVIGSDGKVVGGNGPPGLALSPTDARAVTGKRIVELTRGALPTGPGEVALDVDTARKAGYRLGDTVTLVTPGSPPTIRARLTGLVTFGAGGLNGATLSVLDLGFMQDAFFGGRDVYTSVSLNRADGVSERELADAAQRLLPEGMLARTGTAVAEQNKGTVERALGFLNTFLLVFAAVSLVVGTFLIVNTFSILVAQRSRELALLRALGASRGQVNRSVLLEAVGVGVTGSTLGLVGGYGLALGLRWLFGRFGLDLGAAAFTVQPTTVVASYAVGIVVTVLAAYLPARRAGRIPPVQALGDDVALPEASLRARMAVGVVLAVCGALAMAAGLLGLGGNALLEIGGGMLAVLVGVALLSPLAGRPVIRGFGLLFRPFGTVGRLATQNSLRNPRRTAATASALMVGLALMAMMSIFGSSASASTDAAIGRTLTSQFVVSNVVNQPFSTDVARQIRHLDGVRAVASVRYAYPDVVGGGSAWMAAVDPRDLAQVMRVPMSRGSLDALGSTKVLVADRVAADRGLAVGDPVTFRFQGGQVTAQVAGTFDARGGAVPGEWLVTDDMLRRGGLRPLDSMLFVAKDPAAPTDAVRDRIERVTADLPTVTVKDPEGYADQQKQQIDQFLLLIDALLALSVLIAILGVVNTLALSVIERTREVGLLRAVGMSRRQLRRMVRLESIVISVFGALLGLGLGVAFGVAMMESLGDEGITDVAVPWARLAGFVVAAALVGVLAAVFPARRAARLDVLRAITTE